MEGSISTRFWQDFFFKILPLLLLFSSVSSQTTDKNICQTNECLASAKNLKDSMDPSIDPCDDFYLYACGNYPKIHKSTNFMPQSTISSRGDENTEEIFDFLKQNNTNEEPEAVHKARKLYSLCLNKESYSNTLQQIEVMLQKLGLPVFSFLSDENKNFDYTTVLAKVTRLAGIKIYFDVGVGPNPYNRTMNIILLTKPAEDLDPNMMPVVKSSDRGTSSQPITESQYFARVTNLMCKDNTSILCKQWTCSLNFERDLIAEKLEKQNTQLVLTMNMPISTINSSSPIPVIYTLKQLQDWNDAVANEVNTKIPKLNWTRYIEEIFSGLNNVTLDLSDPNKVQISIEELDSIKNVLKLIYNNQNVKDIELGIWWKVVFTLLPYVDSNMFDAKNSIVDIGEIATRERRCLEITTKSFGMAVSYIYAIKEKFIKAKTEIRKIFEHIRESFKEIMQQVPWMDETTRQKAIKKLQSMRSYILYPSAIKATSQLNDFYGDAQITNNFYDTMISKIQNQISKQLNKLNQVNDLYDDSWIITPNIVNAYYNPAENTMIIPAAIIGGSIYNNSLRALDYGAIGSIVGHEITHGFDNSGRRYNEIGNIEDWWKPEALNLYREKAKCFLNAYSNYSITQNGITQQADSKATLGEDISDNGGFKEALFAYRRCVSQSGVEPLLPQFENFTHEQLITLSFANLWCESPTIVSQLLGPFMSHSPNGVRVNGVLRNSKEFSEIWKCPKGSNMNPNDNKCTVW